MDQQPGTNSWSFSRPCCCLSNKTGSVIGVAIGVLLSLGWICLPYLHLQDRGSFSTLEAGERYIHQLIVATAVISGLKFLFAGVFYIGVMFKNRKYVLVWIFFQIAIIHVDTVNLFVFNLYWDQSSHVKPFGSNKLFVMTGTAVLVLFEIFSAFVANAFQSDLRVRGTDSWKLAITKSDHVPYAIHLDEDEIV